MHWVQNWISFIQPVTLKRHPIYGAAKLKLKPQGPIYTQEKNT